MTSTWLIGRGMLGKAVVRNLRNRSLWTSPRITPWGHSGFVATTFQNDAREFFSRLDPFDSWEVVWCAGAGVVGTSNEHFAVEIEALSSLLVTLDLLAPRPGRLFFASSVGAVHAGSVAAPFTELSPCLPMSEYGFARVQQEALVQDWVRSGHRAVIGRITNLYGPGQRLSKPQGLVSQICKSFLLRQPITLYVSLGITRDYLFVDDAGDMVVALLDSLDGQPDGTSSVRILSSGTNTMLASLLQTCWRVLRRPLRVITVQSELSGLQPKDLRVRPIYPILRPGTTTPLAVGVRRTFEDLLIQFQAGVLNSTLPT